MSLSFTEAKSWWRGGCPHFLLFFFFFSVDLVGDWWLIVLLYRARLFCAFKRALFFFNIIILHVDQIMFFFFFLSNCWRVFRSIERAYHWRVMVSFIHKRACETFFCFGGFFVVDFWYVVSRLPACFASIFRARSSTPGVLCCSSFLVYTYRFVCLQTVIWDLVHVVGPRVILFVSVESWKKILLCRGRLRSGRYTLLFCIFTVVCVCVWYTLLLLSWTARAVCYLPDSGVFILRETKGGGGEEWGLLATINRFLPSLNYGGFCGKGCVRMCDAGFACPVLSVRHLAPVFCGGGSGGGSGVRKMLYLTSCGFAILSKWRWPAFVRLFVRCVWNENDMF